MPGILLVLCISAAITNHFISISTALKYTLHICALTHDQVLEQCSVIPYFSMKPTSADSFVVINYAQEQIHKKCNCISVRCEFLTEAGTEINIFQGVQRCII
jgi:hypothetical protein